MDQEMEREFRAIVADETPLLWLSFSYPGSTTLPRYLNNLQERVEYTHEVLMNKNENASVFSFWLPGLFDPGNFLSLIVQHEARKQGYPTDEMAMQWSVTEICDDSLLHRRDTDDV
jgi:hypothetical protein